MDAQKREFALRVLQEGHPIIEHITYNPDVSICSIYIKEGLGDDLPATNKCMTVWLPDDLVGLEELILDKFEHQVVLYYERKGEYDQADKARLLLTQARNKAES